MIANLIHNEFFLDFVLKRGNIPFAVRGNLTCDVPVDFGDMRIFPPTMKVKSFLDAHSEDAEKPFFIRELENELVFYGEIDLLENSRVGVQKTLIKLDIWADFICFANANPKQPQVPVEIVVTSQRLINIGTLKRFIYYSEYVYEQLPESERKKVTRALSWYRKACNTMDYSIFDCYTGLWNCVEILCTVPKKDGKGIRSQIESSLYQVFGDEHGGQWAYYCFKVKPDNNRLYQIRNDINHGNILETTLEDFARISWYVLVLQGLVFQLLRNNLGIQISDSEKDIHTLVKQILEPYVNSIN